MTWRRQFKFVVIIFSLFIPNCFCKGEHKNISIVNHGTENYNLLDDLKIRLIKNDEAKLWNSYALNLLELQVFDKPLTSVVDVLRTLFVESNITLNELV